LAKDGTANNTATIKLITIFMISSSFKRIKKIAELPSSRQLGYLIDPQFSVPALRQVHDDNSLSVEGISQP